MISKFIQSCLNALKVKLLILAYRLCYAVLWLFYKPMYTNSVFDPM